jgi:hypothetical protein
MSEVEKYLDGMFDRLAGTGEAGRRAIVEAEDHLRSAVEEHTARGVPLPQAERMAVAQFGSSASMARQLRRAYQPDRLRVALSGTALVAGLGLVAGGGSMLVASTVDIARYGVTAGGNVVAGAAPFLVGLLVLIGRWRAIRAGRLAPSGRWLRWLTVGLFAAAAVVLLASPPLTGFPRFDGLFGFHQGPGLRVSLIASSAALLTAILLAARQSRAPRRHGAGS